MKMAVVGLLALGLVGCSLSPVSQRALIDQCKGLAMESVVYFYKDEVKRITCVPSPEDINHRVEVK